MAQKKTTKKKSAPPKGSKSATQAKASAAAPKTEKLRIHALAKELGLASKELLEKLQALGYEFTSIQSTLTRGEADKATKALQKKSSAKKSKPAKKAAKKAEEPARPKAKSAPKSSSKKAKKAPKKAAEEPASKAKKSAETKTPAKSKSAKKASSKKAVEPASSKAKKTSEPAKKAASKKAEQPAKKTKAEKPAKKAASKKAPKSSAKAKKEPAKKSAEKPTKSPKATKKTTKAKSPRKSVQKPEAEEPGVLPKELLKRLAKAENIKVQGDPVETFTRLIVKGPAPEYPGPSIDESDDEPNWEEALEAHLQTQAAPPEVKEPEPSYDDEYDEDEFDEYDDEYDDDEYEDDEDDDGMVRIKVFHPDVVPGGGYIEREVRADQVPPGAIVVEGRPRQPTRSSRAPRTPESFLPTGGILDAGRKLMATGRLNIREEPPVAQAAAAPEATPAVEKAPTPPQGEDEAKAKGEAKGGLGAGFLQGLPASASQRPGGSDSAKQALMAAFGGGPKPPAAARPAAARAPAPPARAAARQAPASRPPRGMILDGRMIETGSAKDSEKPSLSRFREVPSPHEGLQLAELQISAPRKKPVDGHLLLWEPDAFELLGKVNDSDPRPRVWAEEGILGLGRAQREEELQRWSMREWWEQLVNKEYTPIAAFAGSRVVRDFQQVAFVFDPDYSIYRLYQPKGLELSGEYPMLLIADGRVHFASLSLDGVGERERITEARMAEILGDNAPEGRLWLAFSAIPFWQDREALALLEPEHLTHFRDQLEYLFAFPRLELPDPLGGTGSIKLSLGLWEMSQSDAKGQQLREDAAQEKAVTFNASAGFVSDLVRRELWRMKGKPAERWGGYTPREVAESIRVALREDHYNMQGFQPKKPGDYTNNPETGEFQIVLKRQSCTHTLLLTGQRDGQELMGALIVYPGTKAEEGLDPLVDYAALVEDPKWQSHCGGVQWEQGWLIAPSRESRCLWADASQLPTTPIVRHMPQWNLGVALGLFLVERL